MKKFLLFLFAMCLLTSCDFTADPMVIGTSEIELNDDGQYVCRLTSKATYVVDSLLTLKDGHKEFIDPIEGKDVTIFTYNQADKIYFYRGHASAEEIKTVWYQGFSGNGTLNFTLIFICVIILYGIASYKYHQSKD